MRSPKKIWHQPCATCGIDLELWWRNKNKKYCSIRCSKVGELNSNWKGKSSLYGSDHPAWKGDKVGLDALHVFVTRRYPKPENCSCCGKSGVRLDLANISQEYKRDISDWEWLCRKCHMTKDGRLDNLIRYDKRKK